MTFYDLGFLAGQAVAIAGILVAVVGAIVWLRRRR